MASISKRLDGRYRVRWIGADGREDARHFDTKKDAAAHRAKVEVEIPAGTFVDPKRGRQSFHDFAVEWGESQDWKATTRENFPRVLARAEKVLPHAVTLAAIDQLVIKRARLKLSERYAPATVDLTASYIIGVMRAAYATRRVAADPTIGTRSRRRRASDAGRVGADDVPTRAEVLAIWNAAPPRYRAAIALGASGLRVGEVLGLTADRVDVEAGVLVVDRQLQRINNQSVFTTVKGEKPRTIRIPSAVALELRRHVREYGEGLLFRGRRTGASMRRDQFYDSAWHPALVGAGLTSDRFVFHSLRHFAASTMLAENVNPMAVAGHLGDTLETLQRVYAHWMRDDRDVPADALDRIFSSSDPAAAKLG